MGIAGQKVLPDQGLGREVVIPLDDDGVVALCDHGSVEDCLHAHEIQRIDRRVSLAG